MATHSAYAKRTDRRHVDSRLKSNESVDGLARQLVRRADDYGRYRKQGHKQGGEKHTGSLGNPSVHNEC